jgi:alkanesulfonate monooxygenase SsuD/methylene tetrahydromethanopterin reductase-like flavin-dependent oxidoreductase (luciferase family)
MRRVSVSLQDDLDGSEPAETVRFGLDGQAYEIDLNAEHLAKLRAALEPWIAAARPAGAGVLPRPRNGGGKIPTREIRRWAAAHGVPVQARGRLPDEVRQRYLATQEALAEAGDGIDVAPGSGAP